jgi:hypothetical protein
MTLGMDSKIESLSAQEGEEEEGVQVHSQNLVSAVPNERAAERQYSA